VRFDDPYFLYGSEVKAAVPFHPAQWKSRSNDIFNLEGGRNRSIRVQDTREIQEDLQGAWRKAKTSGLENLRGLKDKSDLADNYNRS
jgi:hypothetical protein